MSLKQNKLSWIVVSDVQKAKKFFTETLGLTLNSSAEEYGWLEFVGQDGGAMLGVSGASEGSPKAGSNAVVTFTVNDLEKTKKDLEDKGVEMHGEVVEVPGHVKLQTFSDLDGNLFQLVEELNV